MAGPVADDAAIADAPERSPKPWQRFGRMELNAVALMAATGISALLGFAFWAIAARTQPTEEVGRVQAIINTALMFSQIASANVGVLFGRILVGAAKRARRVVLVGYGAATGLGLVLGFGFLGAYSVHWTSFDKPGHEIFVSPWEPWLFPALIVLFCFFSLQDWVLIGIRGSTWVPVEQLLFSAAKLGLLVWFAAMATTDGLLWAWVIPCALAVVVINAVLLFRALPRMPEPTAGTVPLPNRRDLVKAFLAEYATGTTTVAVPLVLPLLVVGMLGKEANAYYSLPWLIAESMGLLIWNISSSYVVEASHDSREQAALMKRSLRLSFVICLLGVPFLVIAGPWLLTLLPSGYSAKGAPVLQLLALAVPFMVVQTTYMNTARVRNQMGRVVALELFIAVVVIGLALVLMPALGIAGTGWAYLTGEVLAAALTIVPIVRILRAGTSPAVPSGEPSPLVSSTMPLPVVSPTVVAPHDPTRPMPAVTRGPTP